MKEKGGFTLIELVIVIIILGILVAVGLPIYTTTIEKARAQIAIQQIEEIQQSCVQWAVGRSGQSDYTGMTMAGLGYTIVGGVWTPIANSLWNYSISNSTNGGTPARPVIVATKATAPSIGNRIRYQLGPRDTGNGNWPEGGTWGTSDTASTHPGQP